VARSSSSGRCSTADEGWREAVEGCSQVLHVASPLGITNESADLVAAARDGTLRVLRAAVAAGVERVVVTSAANAASPVSYRDEGVSDETLWTDPEAPNLIPYRRAKTLAEKAAWDHLSEHSARTTLTTILPGALFGPILTPDNQGSVQLIGRMLAGMPGTPKIGFEIVDVRDLADIHIRAMTARMDPSLREIMPALGRRNRHTTAKAARLLDWHPAPPRKPLSPARKASWRTVRSGRDDAATWECGRAISCPPWLSSDRSRGHLLRSRPSGSCFALPRPGTARRSSSCSPRRRWAPTSVALGRVTSSSARCLRCPGGAPACS
jgi:hypothetical protein